MAITAADVRQVQFNASRFGYDPQDVDRFLDRIASELDDFERTILELRIRCEIAEAYIQAHGLASL